MRTFWTVLSCFVALVVFCIVALVLENKAQFTHDKAAIQRCYDIGGQPVYDGMGNSFVACDTRGRK